MGVKITGLENIQAKLKRLSETGVDMKPKLNTIGIMIKNSIEESFERETSPFGERWKLLSSVSAFASVGGKSKAYTKNFRSQKSGFLKKFGAGGSKRLLVEDGNLSSNWVVNTSSNKVVVSNNSSNNGFAYGLTHQFGSNNGWGRGIKIPARPFLPVDKDGNLQSDLKDEILKYLKDEILKSFK